MPVSYALGHLRFIGALTLQHVELVAAALSIALLIAIPAGIAAAKNARTAPIVFGGAGVIYTIPSLALLALAVRYLGLGFWPVVLVLAAYAQFMLVRAIAVGLNGVPSDQIDAARGLGMSERQSFIRVQVPLAAPVFLGGLRLATVALIAIATLGGYAGAGGLGTEIFFGLERQYVAETLAGSVPAALLAIAADLLLRAIEGAVRRRTA